VIADEAEKFAGGFLRIGVAPAEVRVTHGAVEDDPRVARKPGVLPDFWRAVRDGLALSEGENGEEDANRVLEHSVG